MPASWRDDCHATRAVACRRGTAGSNQRDSEAAGLHTTAHCLTLIPRRRVPLAGSVGAKRIKVGGTTKRTMCVVCCPGSKAARPASQRSEKRSVRLFLHANPPRSRWAHLLDSFSGAVATAQANNSDSPLVERNGRLCDEMAKGKSRQTAV
jgi:hypothetical protein